MSLRLPVPSDDTSAGSRRAALAQAAARHVGGDLAGAEAQYLRLLASGGEDREVLFLLGTLYLQAANWPAAVRYLEMLVRLEPGHAEGWFHLGLAHRENHEHAAAEAIFLKLLQANERHLDALLALADLLAQQARYLAAQPYYLAACAYFPELPQVHHALGKFYFSQRAYAQAQTHLARATQLQPQDPDILCDLGTTLRKQNRPEEAETCLRQAILLQGQHADAHFNLADVLLYRGEFTQGWAEYEWRFRIRGRAPIFHDQPLWDGAPLDGKTILIQAEQGFGDTFQFVRYLVLLKALGARVMFECQTGLRRLLRACPYIDELVERTPTLATPSNYDVYAPLLSLPRILGTTAEHIPRDLPYLHLEPATRERWQARFAEDPNLKIGIVWSGKPSHIDNPNRRCDINDFAPLAAIPGVSLYSLQQGPAAEEFTAAPWTSALTNLHDEIDDFADTAAAICVLDLVVTVDTSVAHLAGALGRPVWLLLSNAPDWRWLAAGEDSAWYPSMRLFRQPRAGDWASPMAQICAEIPSWVQRPRVLLGATPGASLAYSAPLITSLRRAREALAAGELGQARYELEAVLCSAPHHAEANLLFGEVLFAQGEWDAAQAALNRVQLIWPEHPPLLRLMGDVAQARGDYAAATRYFERALNLGNESGITWQALGVCCLALGLHAEALRAYRRAWDWSPHAPDISDKLGQLLQSVGRLSEALEFFQRALQADANFFPAQFHLGSALMSCGRSSEAESVLRRAVDLRPDSPPAHNNLGVALKALGRYAEAEAAFRLAIQLQANYSEAYNNLGNVLSLQLRLDEAQAAFREALLHDATNAQAYNNLGITLQGLGADGAAIQCYEAAILLRSNFAEAHWNLALARLAQGDWRGGFAGYDWGFDAGTRFRLPLGTPQWEGDIAPDKTLFVHAEQGFGDTLQFVRFLRLAKARVAKLICCVQAPLLRLLAENLISAAWADEVIADTDALPPHDIHIALLSLPRVLNIGGELGVPVPYLHAPTMSPMTRQALQAATGLKVGLVWAGLVSHQNDRRRSLPLRAYEPLLATEGINFYSLQKPAATHDLPAKLIDLAPFLSDFAETAAVIAALDLVITVDTAVAHLAGALGVRTWVLLPYAPDWRWGLQGQDNSWYPELVLFRQASIGDWTGPLHEIQRALLALRDQEA